MGVPPPAARTWLALAIAVDVAIAVLDIEIRSITVAGALMVGPIMAAMRLGPRDTGVVAAAAIVLAVLVGLASESMGAGQQIASSVIGVIASLLAVWLAALRQAGRIAAHEAHGSRDRLDAILGSLADGVTVQDSSGAIVYANDAAARTLGFASTAEVVASPAAEIAGRFEMFGEDGDPLDVERLPARRAFRGEPADPIVVRFRTRGTGDERWAIVKTTPLLDEHGMAEMAVNIFEDITDLKRAEISQRFLAESGRALAASLDHQETLRTVAELAVPDFASWCTVDMYEEGRLERVAVAHADPDRVALAFDLQRRYPPDASAEVGAAQVIRTGRTELYPVISDEMLVQGAQDDEHLEILRSLGMQSAMIVPIPGHDAILGAITFVGEEGSRPFDARDIDLAEEVARRAGVAIENARLYGERAEVAHTLQESLLPAHLPEIPGIEIAACYHAAGAGIEVGGDFYDVFALADGSWAAVIGDVCGKGATAAATTALARYTIRAAAMRATDPVEILSTLNEALLAQREDRQFCTVTYIALTPAERGACARVACAGHPEPLVLRSDGRVEAAGNRGTLLGVVPDPDLAVRELELDPGDALVLFTDGVTEARVDGGLFGLDRLAETVRAAAGADAVELAGRVEAAVVDADLRDDVAILALRVPPAVELDLTARPDAVHDARTAVDALVEQVGEAAADDVRLLVSELVTNALRHGAPTTGAAIGLVARLAAGRLRVEVSDPGGGFDPDRGVRHAASGDGGWGLLLVERLASRWGVERGRGTTVWFELDLGGAGRP